MGISAVWLWTCRRVPGIPTSSIPLVSILPIKWCPYVYNNPVTEHVTERLVYLVCFEMNKKNRERRGMGRRRGRVEGGKEGTGGEGREK